jgi:ParB-like chromosome segregation protein Spo0J
MTATTEALTSTAKTEQKTIRISDIKIGSRFRKDLGDIEGLAKTIQDAGCLLQPIGINEDNLLIFGARRLEACKSLGWTEIPFTLVPIQDIIKGEFYENVIRKDFTVSERVAILEEIERQRIGHKLAKGDKLSPFQKQEKGKKSRDIVARYTGIGPVQLSKEKKIVQVVRENPDDTVEEVHGSETKLKDILEKVDRRKMKINKADRLIRAYEYRKARLAEYEAIKKLPPPPPLTDKEKQDLKSEQDRILKEAFDGHFFNENEYEDLGNGIRLIQGNPLEVSSNIKFINLPVSTVRGNKRIIVTQTVQMERYGIEDNSVDLIFTNPSYALHNMIPEYSHYNANGYQDPPTYRDTAYLADRVLKEGSNFIIGVRYQFHRLIPSLVYFMSHSCDNERVSNYGLFHNSASCCNHWKIRFNSIIICEGRLLLLWFTKKTKDDNSSSDNDYSDTEEIGKDVFSIDDVIKRFTASENDVVLDPLMDHGDIGIAA